MRNSQMKISGMENEIVNTLWCKIEEKGEYEKLPRYEESTSILHEALMKIDNMELKLDLEEMANAALNDTMYQGFILGLKEASQLLFYLGMK